MTTAEPGDAIMIGGPRDGERLTAPEAALVQLQIDGLSHRYIRTTATREIDGHHLLVYNYDGEIR